MLCIITIINFINNYRCSEEHKLTRGDGAAALVLELTLTLLKLVLARAAAAAAGCGFFTSSISSLTVLTQHSFQLLQQRTIYDNWLTVSGNMRKKCPFCLLVIFAAQCYA